MAATDINIEPFVDPLLVLGTAGVVVPLVRRFGISPVLGYLVAGAIIGPLGLGSLKYEWPMLRWLTIRDAQNVAGIAELGVIFLLFLIGLELSFERLSTMRRFVFGLGGLQVVLTSAALFGLLFALGIGAEPSLVLGISLALSSTAIVLEVMSQGRRLATAAGRASFAILLAQDLAVIPLLLLIAGLAASGTGSVLGGLAVALTQAGIAVLVLVIAGRVLLRPLFHLVAGVGSQELFIATTLFVVVASGVAAGLAGLSMALGAFVGGLLLAETEYRKAIEAIVEPFKALLLGVFFFTIGMRIDVRAVTADPLFILAALAVLIGLKVIILLGLMRLFRLPRAAALESGLMLGPGGEFAFVGIGMATAAGVVGAQEAGTALAVTSLSMALIPSLHQLGRRAGGLMVEAAYVEPPAPPDGEDAHTIVIGHGRVGSIVVEMLERHGLPFVATDNNPATIAAERGKGRPVYFGNATEPGYLEKCGLAKARAVVITIHDQKAIDLIVARIRLLRPDIFIVSRARDGAHAQHLYVLGVTDAVPETIEASLQLSEAALVGVGMPVGLVIASIHEKRDEFRHTLQEAAKSAGMPETRSIRPPAQQG